MYDVVHKLVLAVILSIGKWIYRRLESQYYGVFGVEFQIAISELRVSLVDYQPSSYLSYLPGAGTLRYCIVCMYIQIGLGPTRHSNFLGLKSNTNAPISFYSATELPKLSMYLNLHTSYCGLGTWYWVLVEQCTALI